MSQLQTSESSESSDIKDEVHDNFLLHVYQQGKNIGKPDTKIDVPIEIKSNEKSTKKSTKKLFIEEKEKVIKAKIKKTSDESHANETTEQLSTFVIGTPCRVTYDEDNLEYEATIVDNLNNQHVIVEFVGYGNTQKVHKLNLKKSHGLQARMNQHEESLEYNNINSNEPILEHFRNNNNFHTSNTASTIFNECAFPPPPPFPFSRRAMNMSDEEYESLNAMLMANYVKGFYTGYYQYMKSKK